MIKQTANALNLSSEAPFTDATPAREETPSLALPAAANENVLELDAATRLAAEALAREKAREKRERARAAERRRWLVLLVLMLSLVVGLRTFAAEVVRVLPGATKLYQAAGLNVSLPRLDVDALHVRWVPMPDGRHDLAISGRIVNRTGRQVRMAPVSMELLDAVGRPIYSWRIGKNERVLANGAQARFHTRLGSVPLSAVSVRARILPINAAK